MDHYDVFKGFIHLIYTLRWLLQTSTDTFECKYNWWCTYNPSQWTWWHLDCSSSSRVVPRRTSPPNKQCRTTRRPRLRWTYGKQLLLGLSISLGFCLPKTINTIISQDNYLLLLLLFFEWLLINLWEIDLWLFINSIINTLILSIMLFGYLDGLCRILSSR